MLSQQRVYVLVCQSGARQLAFLEFAADGEDTGRMVDHPGHPAVPTADRDEAMCDQQGDQRHR